MINNFVILMFVFSSIMLVTELHFIIQLLLSNFHVISTGKAEGMLYEDDGDSFGFKHGKYLLTHYEAQQFKEDGDEVVVRVVHSEGQWTRPNRKLHVRLLLGSTTEVEGECKDGEELRIKLPSKVEINELVQSNRKINIAERGSCLALKHNQLFVIRHFNDQSFSVAPPSYFVEWSA